MCICYALVLLCLSTCAVPPEGNVRLVGGPSLNEGHVEVYHNGKWGTVCDDGWDIDDASVVCRQLGHLLATGAPGGATFGAGSGPIWYGEVNCTGNERNLTQCSHSGVGVHKCVHGDDAGVICASKP